ncbi:hypothetical protein [uncultured Duncaniella sp.]|nr:hypothetical protein [uncultured Duncaniella sp.]
MILSVGCLKNMSASRIPAVGWGMFLPQPFGKGLIQFNQNVV